MNKMALQPEFDAVIFDLDGVITKTALVHALAWKKMFDQYMLKRREKFGEPFKEFTHAGDYLPYVDGKPRYKGVASFLESRGIDIPYGDPSDDPDKESVCGLGNRKNFMFNQVLDQEGVEVYKSSVKMLASLKEAGVRIGVASSSKNCKPVLEKAGLLDYFETRVDGVVSAEIGLKGKPEPDIFTTACDNLGVNYHRSVVVEDAISGVQAGRKGNFGLVLGVAREDNIQELYAGGADIVVEDLAEISLEGINEWFVSGIKRDGWLLHYFDYKTDMERSREALLAVGNGYFGTRGAMEESRANKVNYPGTYISGLFNRLVSKVAGRDIENEDFVNIPNWIPVTFRIDNGPWFDFTPDPTMEIRSIKRSLDYYSGGLTRELIVEDEQGRITRVLSTRFASMAYPHCAGIKYSVKPLNYEATIEIRSQLRGDHQNSGVERYNELNQQHLSSVTEEVPNDIMKLVVKTTQSNILIAVCAANRLISGSRQVEKNTETGNGWLSQSFKVKSNKDQEVTLEKLVSLYTSRDPGVDNAPDRALSTLASMNNFPEEFDRSARSWAELWRKLDILIDGDRESQRLVRLHLFQMMVSASPHHAGLDSGIPPRGLHGEAYRGHIFWDELFMLPLYNLHLPEVTKSVLMYRYRRLDAARKNALEHGYQGAMFPWQSGSDGREETQVIHLNPLSGEWGDDYSSLQRHISLAIAYNVCNYYHATADLAFMDHYGAELLLDICKFWVSKSILDKSDGRYHIDKVMGPDEFHEKLPDAEEGGLTDNAYSNIMVSWMLNKALKLLNDLTGDHRDRICKKLSLTPKDFDHWKDIMKGISLNIREDGVIEQFRGYFGLEELDWDHYREQYENIDRLDRILKAEGKSPDDYKLSKQADLLMSFYNLGQSEVSRIIEGLGYNVPEDYMRTNFNYYIERTSHGSTLSRLVHGRLAWKMGMTQMGWDLYLDALRSDLVDIQGGTTGEGIHCGVMAGTVYEVISTYAGLDLSGELPALDPAMPAHWNGLEFNFLFRGTRFFIEIGKYKVNISCKSSGKDKIKIHLCGKEIELSQDEPVSVNINN